MQYGNETCAKMIARAIVSNRPINSTVELAQIIKQAVPRKVADQSFGHPATKSFQALRITVNNEVFYN